MDSAAVVTVVTADGASHAFDRARLAALPQVEVRAAFHDGPEHAFRGPTVQSVLEAAGVPLGRALRGEALATVVVAEAADGYRVAYSLGELDEGIVARPAIVALAMDGGPLEPKDGAARLLLAGEKRPSRWIRQLVRLRVVRLPA
jgi:hypothetical protein